LKLLSRVGSYISVETHAFHASIILIEIAEKQHIFSFVFEINNKLKDFQWIRRKCDNVTVQYYGLCYTSWWNTLGRRHGKLYSLVIGHL
jgi:hypothetical protein